MAHGLLEGIHARTHAEERTMNVELSAIELGSQVYLQEGGDPFGGIRDVRRSGRGELSSMLRMRASLSSQPIPFRAPMTGKLFLIHRSSTQACRALLLMRMTEKSPVSKDHCCCDP
jgi:hypothetical protein